MRNVVKKPRAMFRIDTFKVRVNMFIAEENRSELERKMGCDILENVLRSSGNYNKYEINSSKYDRKYL